MNTKFPLVLFGFLSLATAVTCRAAAPYHFIKEIPVGGEGGWDYLSVDEAGRRLYVSHATKVIVIDLDKDAVVGQITNTPGIHGVAIASDLGRGITSNGQENKAGIVDLQTLQIITKLPTGANPDGMLYEPSRHEAYLFNGRGQSATVIDVQNAKVVTTIALPGKPEFATVDPELGRVYDNLEDKSQVAVIDINTHRVVNTWPVAPGEEPSGMAIDTAHHRLFLGCGNGKMVMMDASNGKVVSEVPIGRGVDANAFDPASQLAFASCGDGTVTIAHEDSPEKLTVVQTLKTEPSARTMTIDPRTHRIYLAAAKYGPQAQGTSGGPRGRPPIVRGSFKVLVYGPGE